MSIRVTQSMLALGLVLGCVAVQIAAQERGAAKPPTTLWSVLNLPTLDRLAKPAQPRPKQQPTIAVDKTKSSPADLPNIDIPAVNPPESPDPESAVVSPFSSISSNRRSAIQKREMSHDAPAAAAPRLNPPPATAPHITPHWTPKFAEQTAYLRLADDGSAQPVAVNMAGDLISQRVTVARAVAGMDPTLKVAPPIAHAHCPSPATGDATEKSVSSISTASMSLHQRKSASVNIAASEPK